MKKNVAGQMVGAQLVSATDGSAFTGAVTVSVTVDAGTQAAGSVGAGACTHEGNGYHTYAPAQAETNGDLVAFTFTGTGAVPVTIQVYTSFPQSADAPTAAANADAVWDELRAGHTTTGSFGEVSTTADVAAAVWDETRSGHTSTGTFGEQLQITSNVKKNVALSNFMFQMFDASSHAPAAGLTVSCFISQDGGAFAATTTATATAVSNGWYKINLTQTEMNANVIAFRATATGADETGITLITQS